MTMERAPQTLTFVTVIFDCERSGTSSRRLIWRLRRGCHASVTFW